MQIITDEKYRADRSVVALGMFDGVHIGHRVLLERAASLAHQRGVPLIVRTFLEHPLQLIAPEKCPPSLSTFEERNALMKALGVDVLVAQPFTPETMNLLPEEYVGHLVRRFHPTDVVCGYNHTFGRKGEGTPALLTALGAGLGFATSIVPQITYEGCDVSSTVIRGLLKNGDVDVAARLLGRPYHLNASLLSREENQCVLELTRDGKQRLPDGSYRVACKDGQHCYPAVVHIRGEQASIRLPDSCALTDAVQLHMLCNCAIDF